MNFNQNIKKILLALKQKGKLYKINSFQFYSKKSKKYNTKYQILKRIFERRYNPIKDTIEVVEKYKVDYNCYSKIELLEYLVEEYRKGSEVDG